MPVKASTKERHKATAKEFRKWLEINPDASQVRKIGAFNAIADNVYRTVLKVQVEQRKRQSVSRI